MADEQQQDGQHQDGATGESKYSPESLEDAMRIIAALEKRVDEREATIKDERRARESLAERMQSIEQAQRQRLEEEGNYKQLLDQTRAELDGLKPYQERAQALEQIIREANEARIAQLPEHLRDAVPTDYPPEKLQGWLVRAAPLLTRTPAPSFDAGAGGNDGSSRVRRTLNDEQKRAARLAGITDEEMLAMIEQNERERDSQE